MNEVDAVLLDGLGTLVALDPPGPALVKRLREAHGVEISSADAQLAFAAEIAYYRAHHHEGRDRPALEDLRRRCAEVLRARLPVQAARTLSVEQVSAAMLDALRFTAYPDASAALPRLRAAGLTLIVASNWDVSLAAVLRDVGLEELLDGVVSSAAVGHTKPARPLFEAALALAGSAPQRTLHVGDSIEHDVRGALAAGIRPVLLQRDYGDLQAPPGNVPTISSLIDLLA